MGNGTGSLLWGAHIITILMMNAIKGHRSNHYAGVVLSPGENSSEDKGVDLDITQEGLGR